VIDYTHLEGEVTRVIIESAAQHEGEDVLHALGAEDLLGRDGADAAVGQGGGDHALRLASHLQRTSLTREKETFA